MRFSVLAILLILPLSASGQTWTYQGNTACYTSTSGTNSFTYCTTQGEIQGFVTHAYQNPSMNMGAFEAGYGAGQGLGSLVVNLIKAWRAHRHRVKVEERQLHEALSEYLDAWIGMMEEGRRLDTNTNALYEKLSRLDAKQSDNWNGARVDGEKIVQLWDQRIEAAKTYREKVLRFKRAKDLKFLLDNKKSGVKTFYEMATTSAARSYVMNQLVQAAVGIVQHAVAAKPVGTSIRSSTAVAHI